MTLTYIDHPRVAPFGARRLQLQLAQGGLEANAVWLRIGFLSWV